MKKLTCCKKLYICQFSNKILLLLSFQNKSRYTLLVIFLIYLFEDIWTLFFEIKYRWRNVGSCTDSIFHVAPSMYIRENLEGLRVIFHLRQWIRGSGTRWGKNVITRIEYMHAHTTFAKKQMYRNILLKIWTCTTTTLCDQQNNHFIFFFY